MDTERYHTLRTTEVLQTSKYIDLKLPLSLIMVCENGTLFGDNRLSPPFVKFIVSSRLEWVPTGLGMEKKQNMKSYFPKSEVSWSRGRPLVISLNSLEAYVWFIRHLGICFCTLMHFIHSLQSSYFLNLILAQLWPMYEVELITSAISTNT